MLYSSLQMSTTNLSKKRIASVEGIRSLLKFAVLPNCKANYPESEPCPLGE